MKSKGLLLILAGVVVVLAGIAIYGYVSVANMGTLPGGLSIQVVDPGTAAAGFDAVYDILAKSGQTDALLGNNSALNFLIRYRQVFAVAAAVAFAGSAMVSILLLRKKVTA